MKSLNVGWTVAEGINNTGWGRKMAVHYGGKKINSRDDDAMNHGEKRVTRKLFDFHLFFLIICSVRTFIMHARLWIDEARFDGGAFGKLIRNKTK